MRHIFFSLAHKLRYELYFFSTIETHRFLATFFTNTYDSTHKISTSIECLLRLAFTLSQDDIKTHLRLDIKQILAINLIKFRKKIERSFI